MKTFFVYYRLNGKITKDIVMVETKEDIDDIIKQYENLTTSDVIVEEVPSLYGYVEDRQDITQ